MRKCIVIFFFRRSFIGMLLDVNGYSKYFDPKIVTCNTNTYVTFNVYRLHVYRLILAILVVYSRA